MSMMVSFVLSFFPRDVLDEILNLIESVSEDFPSYSYNLSLCTVLMHLSFLVEQWIEQFSRMLFLVYFRVISLLRGK